MAGILHLNALLGSTRTPESDDWAERIWRQAQQAPIPDAYPHSPIMPPLSLDGVSGRVIDESTIVNALLNPPQQASDSGEASALEMRTRSRRPPRGELYPWWGWRQRPMR